MSNEAVITVSNDPLRSVADALDAAVQGAKGGVEDLRVTASGCITGCSTVSSPGSLTRPATLSPTESSFPRSLVARAIPKENAAVHGLIDGARAAIDMVKEMRAKSLSAEHPDTSLPDPETTRHLDLVLPRLH